MSKIKKAVGIHKIKNSFHLVFVLLIILGGVFSVSYIAQAYPEAFQSKIVFDNDRKINPEEALEFNFSQPVFWEKYQEGILIEPKKEVKFIWQDNYKKLLIQPVDFWDIEANYKILFPEGKTVMFTPIASQKFNFYTVSYPKVNNFLPPDGSEDVIVDIEDPIKVHFNKSTQGFDLNFSLEPSVFLIHQSNDEKSSFELLPKESLEDGKDYTIKIFAKYTKDSTDNYKEVYSSSFKTLPPPPSVWEDNFEKRLEQARKFTRAKINQGKYIDVNLATQILSIFESGKLLDSFLISSGKAGMETPKGEYQVFNKHRRPWSSKYRLYMPFWMAVTSDGKYGLHELPEWPGGYKEGANHLGIPVSHGCMRLGIGPAERVWNWAQIGTPVVIY